MQSFDPFVCSQNLIKAFSLSTIWDLWWFPPSVPEGLRKSILSESGALEFLRNGAGFLSFAVSIREVSNFVRKVLNSKRIVFLAFITTFEHKI